MSFIDLKIFSRICQSPTSIVEKETSHEFRENNLCPVDGLCSGIRIPKMCRSIQRQSQSDQLFLLGPISLHGLRTVYLPGKLTRHTSLPAGNPVQTLSSGHPREGLPQYTGPCQSEQELADLCRFRSSPYCESQKALRHRFLRHRTGSNGLCTGLDHHRPLSGAFPMGRVPKTQRSCKTPHPSGSAREHSFCCNHYYGEGSRRQYPRPVDYRIRSHLYHGSRLSGFFATFQNSSDVGILCNPSKNQFQPKTPLLTTRRQIHWYPMRSNCRPQRALRKKGLP